MPDPSTKPKISTPLLILIIVIILAAVAVVGYLIWYNNFRVVETSGEQATNQSSQGGVKDTKMTQTSSATPVPTRTPVPSVAPDEDTLDHDQDGYSPREGDCNDYDSSVSPAEYEICDDFVDNNCDGNIDEGCSTATTFDPVTFDYQPYFIYSDEYIFDWYTMDSDRDGSEEVLAVTYSPANDEYHAFILDWDPAFQTYMMDFEEVFPPPFAYIMATDWNVDGWDDYVLAFAENSGYGAGIIYNPNLDSYELLYPAN